MSTKIYNGFILRVKNWQEAHELIMEFREKVAGWDREKFSGEIAQQAVYIYDLRTMGMDTSTEPSALTKYLQEWMKEQVERVELAVLYSYKKRIYGQYFGVYESTWFSGEKVEEFRYWNNTDRPEGVTAREWNRRCRIWDAILGWRSPAMSGFQAQLVDPYAPPPRGAELMEKIPPFEERTLRIATEQLFRDFEGEPGEGVFSRFTRFRERLDSEEGRSKIKKETQKVSEKLEPEITLEKLGGF